MSLNITPYQHLTGTNFVPILMLMAKAEEPPSYPGLAVML